MATAYDPITAKHYAAYRPSLHFPILKKVLDDNSFALGLDVGCGTGQSALALTNFCNKIIAIDSSESMLENAMKHPQVEYQLSNGIDLEFNANTFDVITFAGVLDYCKSQQLLEQVEKVAKPNAQIVIYDFEILLENTLIQLGVAPPSKQQLNYNHETDFSGLEMQSLRLHNKTREQISFEISPADLGHLLLADNDHYTLLANRFGKDDLFTMLTKKLYSTTTSEVLQIEALIYYTVYS